MPSPPRRIRLRYWLALLAIMGGFLFFKQNTQTPILMYHRVENLPGVCNLSVSAETFERQMEFLKVHRYHVIPLAELLDRIKTGKSIAPKTIVITFDDGFLDNIENAFPILRKMNFPAVVFIITNNINKKGWLAEEDLRILDQAGVSVGSHTVHHAHLPDLKPDQIFFELRDSKRRLEEILGHPVTLLSYPSGGYNSQIQDIARKLGYEGAVTTNRGRDYRDAYALHRVKITEANGSLFNFWLKVSGVYLYGKKRIEVT